MLLAVDIGNLTVAVGLFQGKKLVRGWKIMTDREKTSDEYEVLLVNLFQYAKIDLEKVEGVILSSVVPPLTPVFQAASENLFREKALVVGPGLRTGMPILYENPLEVGADASVAFPPHRLESPLLRADPPPGLRPDFEGRLYDARSVSARAACAPEPDHLHFQTVVPMWDNTPRRQRDGTIFLNASPAVFRASLRDCFMRARTMLPPGQRFVFVNAWNEWAEGNHLEPGQRWGRAYLEATRAAREATRADTRAGSRAPRRKCGSPRSTTWISTRPSLGFTRSPARPHGSYARSMRVTSSRRCGNPARPGITGPALLTMV